jgi:hypothetical protein
MGVYTQHDRERITAIAEHLLAGEVKGRRVDPQDEAAMEIAMRRCVREAATIYNSALEYVSG